MTGTRAGGGPPGEIPGGPPRARASAVTRVWRVAGNTALILLVVALDLGGTTSAGQDVRLFWPYAAVAAVALGLRNRAPVAVLGFLLAASTVRWSVNRDVIVRAAILDPPTLLGLYAVAVLRPRRTAYAAAATVILVTLVGVLPQPPEGRLAESAVATVATTTAALLLGLNVRARRRQVTLLRDRAERLERERDQQATIAVAAERARIARELHDIVAHHLAVMIALADGAVAAAPTAPDAAAAAMGEVSGTGRAALADMRRLLGVLRDDPTDALTDDPRRPQPGVARLDELLDRVRATGLPARLAVEGEPAALDAGHQLTVYRLVQEALTNTLKHADDATAVLVQLAFTAGTLTVEVTDDGRPTAPPGLRGHGVQGMRERVELYGGTLAAGPAPGGGWRVRAHFDLTGDPVGEARERPAGEGAR